MKYLDQKLVLIVANLQNYNEITHYNIMVIEFINGAWPCASVLLNF